MTTTPRELDVRSVPPPQRHPLIYGTFDALAADEAFVLVNDHNPKPLLYQLQVERAGQFEWSALEAGPERFRIEIRRRATEGPRNVTEHLGEDHRRLDAIMGGVRQSVGAQDLAQAARQFSEFQCGLDHHIRAEEELVFPAFEKLSGAEHGPSTVMRSEHVEIRHCMDLVVASLRKQDGDGVEVALANLVETLLSHNRKEEQILYPMVDQMLGGARECDDLVRRIQAL